MTIEEIEVLVRRAQTADGGRFEHRSSGARLMLRKNDRGETEAPTASTPSLALTAPAAGVFLARHPSSAPGAFSPSSLSSGAIAGYLQVGPCLRPVTAARDCVVVRTLAEDGALVGFGTPLFLLAAD